MTKHVNLRTPYEDRCIPQAPPGVLGGFIQHKLSEYIEPIREGTPKGQMVGFSKKKYHALLLANLTSLDLKQIAREVATSHGVVRKWSAEKDFRDAGDQILDEFIHGPFDDAARASFIYDFTVIGEPTSDDHVAKPKKKKLIGFEDAAFYSPLLLFYVECAVEENWKRIHDQLSELINREEDPSLNLLTAIALWFCSILAVNYIDRTRTIPARRNSKALRDFRDAARVNVSRITLLIEVAVDSPRFHPQSHFKWIVSHGSRLIRQITK